MDTWPSHTPTQSEKGKVNAALPYPLLQGGALTSATLRDEQRRFEWVTPQNRASSMGENR
jgi:hypothetical protein